MSEPSKSVKSESIQGETTQRKDAPLSELSLTTLVIASMVGAGVFTTSGFALADLKSPWLVMAAWLTGGVIAVCGAMSYAQLTRQLSDSGGEYLFLSRLVHPAAGFIAGWVSLLAGFTGAGAYAAMALEAYLTPGDGWAAVPRGTIAILVVALATLAHVLNTERGARGQSAVVLMKLGLLAAFIVWSFASFEHWQGVTTTDAPAPAGLLAFATSVMWISLSYSGFNAAVYVAGEASSGSKSVSRAMVRGTMIVTGVYLALNAIFVFGPPPMAIAGEEEVATIAASAIGGDWLERLVRIAICLGLATSVSSILMAGPRVYAKMAEDQVFPQMFASATSPPRRSILLQGAGIACVVAVTTLKTLLAYLGLTLALTAAATVGTILFQQRKAAPGESKRNRAMSLAAPIVYVTATLVFSALTAWRNPSEAIAFVVTIAVGLAGYLAVRRLGRSEW